VAKRFCQTLIENARLLIGASDYHAKSSDKSRFFK
jgi:hypothetical protein